MNIPIITTLREARVDAESCVVEGIILTPGMSENGTYYSPEAVMKAAPAFKGVQCYADHPKPDEIERSVRDVVGLIEETWADEAGIRARIRLSRAQDWLLTMIAEGLLGDLSINAMGKTRVSRRDGRVVRDVLEITKAHSVDFVARAAAGGRVEKIIRESAAYGEGLKLIERVTPEELLEARPDVLEKIREKVRSELTAERGDSTSEIQALEDEIERRRTGLVRESIASRLIDSSKLPAMVREFLLMEALTMDVASEDAFESAIAGLIDRHRKYLAGLTSEGVIRGMGSVKEASEDRSETCRSTQRLMGIREKPN